MKHCNICYSRIHIDNYVEFLIERDNHKYILDKYKWIHCDFCIDCIIASKTLLWRLYINTLLNTDCKHTFIKMLMCDVPVWLTDNLGLDGKSIKGLFYNGQMHSAKLETGLNDFQYYNFVCKIDSIRKDLIAMKNAKKLEDINNIERLISDLKIKY